MRESSDLRATLGAARDRLYHSLPCVWTGHRYVVFSPHKREAAFASPRQLDSEEFHQALTGRGFWQGRRPREPKTLNLGFVVTTDCNLRCVHCYARAGDAPSYMSVASAKAILRENADSEADALFLSFFGGEPTLNMEAVAAVVGEAEALPLPVSFHISTNGVTPESTVAYLVSKQMDVTVSLDGIGAANDRLRPARNTGSSSGAVECTIRHLVRENALFQIRVTVSAANVNEIPGLIDYCADLGVRYVHIEPLSLDGRARDNGLALPSPEDYAQSFAAALDGAAEREVLVISSPLMNLLTPCGYFCTSVHGSKWLFNPDGSISTCYKVQSHDSKDGRFVIGSYDSTTGQCRLDTSRIRSLAAVSVEQMPGCSDCFAKYLCAGGCPHRNWTSTGSVTAPDRWSCHVKKLVVRDAVLRLVADSQRKEISPVLGGLAYEQAVAGRLAERNTE